MIWPEIKKAVNTDLSTPINHLIWLNDYKTFGEDSYVFQNKDILHELYRDYRLCMNDASIRAEALSYASTIDEFGKSLTYVNEIEIPESITSINTIEVFANDAANVDMVLNDSWWKNVFIQEPLSAKMMTSLSGLESSAYESMAALTDDADAMTAVSKSAKAIRFVAKMNFAWRDIRDFIVKLNSEVDNVKNVYSALSDATYFEKKESRFEYIYGLGRVKTLDNYMNDAYAHNGLIVSSLCYYYPAYVNMYNHGDLVSRGRSGLSSGYTYVDKGNVNAVCVPDSYIVVEGDKSSNTIKVPIELYIAK